jgi:hypothetical protein
VRRRRTAEPWLSAASERTCAASRVEVECCGVTWCCVPSGSLGCGIWRDSEGTEQEQTNETISFQCDFAFCISRARAPAPHKHPPHEQLPHEHKTRIESGAHGQLVWAAGGRSNTTP